MRWNACMRRLDLTLYSHSKEVLVNGVRTHVNCKRKIPPTRSSEEGRTHDASLSRTASPIHYLLSYSGPQESWHTITESGRTNQTNTIRLKVRGGRGGRGRGGERLRESHRTVMTCGDIQLSTWHAGELKDKDIGVRVRTCV